MASDSFDRASVSARARSFLFLPADRRDRYEKALASGADMVVLDLEDAVGPSAKNEARAVLADAFAGMTDSTRERLAVRINPEGAPWFEADRRLVLDLSRHGLGGLMLPKIEGSALLADLNSECPGLALLPLIETGAGLDALNAIAASPGVSRLCLGHLDLQNDLGIQCGPDETEIAPARWDIVRASRRAGLPPAVDGVTTNTRNGTTVLEDARRALRQGFGAKLCIHPSQLEHVHAAFTPTAQQLDWARRVLQAAAAAVGGACSVDGRMVDAPVIALAERLLAVTD